MRKIGIVVNPDKDPGLQYLNRITAILQQNNIDWKVAFCGGDAVPFPNSCSMEECLKRAELGITLGGDGTLLHVAPCAAALNIPLLGINLGHLGFLAEMDPDKIDLLIGILNGDYQCTERMLLDIQLNRGGKTVFSAVALNDAVIRSATGKPARILLSDAENDLLDYFCDGFIVSTPTGSTAYSMSAGGPIIEPQTKAIVLTPICPHTLVSRSVVLDSNHPIYVRVTNAEGINAHLVCDGADSGELQNEDAVFISRSNLNLRLVKLYEKSFYNILNEKISKRPY